MRIKQLLNYSGVVLATVMLISMYFYLKYKEQDYDSLIGRAYKAKIQYSEFIIFDGEFEPAIPDKEINSKDNLGVDIENNGIRDDVDIWINRTAKSYNERQAMRQYARLHQLLQKDCQDSAPSHSLKVTEDLNRARICLSIVSEFERGGESFGLDILNIIILNTKTRKTCYKLDIIKNSTENIVSIESLKTNCKFLVRNPEIIVEVSKILKNKK